MAAGLSFALVSCATTEETETESTADELSEIARSEIAGSLRLDGDAQEATSSSDDGFRAFEYEAPNQFDLVAYISTTSDVEPIVQVVDAERQAVPSRITRGLTRSDLSIEFAAPGQGRYYLLFRTKQRRAAPFIARLYNASSENSEVQRRTGAFTDGWPVRSSYGGRASTSFAVQVGGQGKVLSNAEGCSFRPFDSGRGAAGRGTFVVTVDLDRRTVGMSTSRDTASAPIASDGSFLIEKDVASGVLYAAGRVAAGGFVVLDEGTRVDCRKGYSGQAQYDATQLGNAVGAAKRGP